MIRSTRRHFLGSAASLAAVSLAEFRAPAQEATAGAPVKITLAQMLVTGSVPQNMERIRAALAQAVRDRAGWILLPEGALSGYHGNFRQEEVAEAFDEVRGRCREGKLVGLIGTCWREGPGKPRNQIRIIDREGALAAQYSKTCLTYGDAKQFEPGGHPLVHTVAGMTFGTLICNDLWVTPGFTDGPNPHLSLQQSRAGAQAIFHAVNSGSDARYRAYHESNVFVRSAEAKCPFVVVNAAAAKGEVNCASGVVQDFEYRRMLPRAGEAVETVEFMPRKK